MANLVGQIKGYHSGAKTIANIYDTKQTAIGNANVLMHFDASPTADACGNGWTASGSPYISSTIITNAQAKFGKALYLNGSSYLQMAQPIVLGGKDFTIDFWAYMSSSTREFGYIFSEPSDKTALNRYFSRGMHAVIKGVECHNDITLDTWHHFAYVYEHGKSLGKIYVDGKAGSKYYSGTIPATSFVFTLGAGNWQTGTYMGTGYVDEFRIVDGKAMWTADFTPPTSAYATTTGASTVNANMMIRHNGANCYIPLTTNAAHTTAPYIAVRHGNTNYYTVK